MDSALGVLLSLPSVVFFFLLYGSPILRVLYLLGERTVEVNSSHNVLSSKRSEQVGQTDSPQAMSVLRFCVKCKDSFLHPLSTGPLHHFGLKHHSVRVMEQVNRGEDQGFSPVWGRGREVNTSELQLVLAATPEAKDPGCFPNFHTCTHEGAASLENLTSRVTCIVVVTSLGFSRGLEKFSKKEIWFTLTGEGKGSPAATL